MRMILTMVAVLMMGGAAEARCLARLSEPLVFITNHCEDCVQLLDTLERLGLKPRVCNILTDADCEQLYDDHRDGHEIPLTFVCNAQIAGNKPRAIMEKIAEEKTEISPGDYDYGEWKE